MRQKLDFFGFWIISQVSNIETSFLEDYEELGEILDIPNRSRSKKYFLGVGKSKIHVSILKIHVSIVKNQLSMSCDPSP